MLVALCETEQTVVRADHGNAQPDDERTGYEEVAHRKEQRAQFLGPIYHESRDSDGQGDEAQRADDARQASQAGVADDDFVKTAAEFYKHLIDNGIPKEDARDVLPLALNSNIVMTMNCRELIHFFGLRLCTKAQKEIRDLAKEMLKLCKERLPEVFENIGPKCKQIGYCNEGKRSCGLIPLKEDVFRIYSEHKSSN